MNKKTVIPFYEQNFYKDGLDSELANFVDPPKEKLTDKERKEIAIQMSDGICRCGHLRGEHSKMVKGLFTGCQHPGCNCSHFLWPEKGEEYA